MSRHRTAAGAALLALLAACGAPAPGPQPGYRDRAVPIASRALFDADRFAGRWHAVAAYPVASGAGCARVTLDLDGGIVRHTCTGPDGSALRSMTGTATLTGPGRLTLDFGAGQPFEGSDFWVLWVAEDYRTAAIGTPTGQAGWILDRDPTIRPDRLAAAREMLDFNGYDLSRLVLAP